MNQELQKQIASLVESANKAGVDLVTFIQQQYPDLLTQITRYKLIDAFVGIVFFSAAALVVLFCAKKWWKNPDRDAELSGLLKVIIGLVLFVLCLCLAEDLETVLRCIWAPKMVALREILELTK